VRKVRTQSVSSDKQPEMHRTDPSKHKRHRCAHISMNCSKFGKKYLKEAFRQILASILAAREYRGDRGTPRT
jgi:predicted RNA-binding protein YlxR (DUF448 family)